MNIRRKYAVKAALWGGAAVAAVLACGTASAQDSAGPSTLGEEIVVTANKRVERLVEVAAAVSAVSGEELTYRNLQRIEDIAAQVPGFNFQPGGPRQVRLILRGLNSGGAGATVAVVADETPLSYQSGLANGAIDTANFDTYDMARIEVLKGPQGTLYGASTQGGLLKYVTNAPDPTRIAASGEAGLESVDRGGTGFFGRGMINVPIVADKIALRATGYYQDVPGYIDNPLRNERNVNGGKRWGGRVSLLIKPSDTVSLRLTAARQLQEFDDGGALQVVGAALAPTRPPANAFDLANGRFELNSLLGNPSRNVYEYLNATLSFEMPFADLTSSTSLGHLSTRFSADISDSAAAPGVSLATAFSPIYGRPIAVEQFQTNASDRVNQEIRLSSKPDSRIGGLGLDWVVGGFYAFEKIDVLQGFNIRDAATESILIDPFPAGSLSAPARYEEFSGFANATLGFTDTVDLSLGGRYTTNKQRSQIFFKAGLATTAVDTVTTPVLSNEDKFTYSAALRWKFNPDSVLYGRISSGYRPGGPVYTVPGTPADIPRAYKADTTVNYEIGLRTRLLNRIEVDVAAFYIDWTDIQVPTTFRSLETGTFVTVTANAGKARSKGIEYLLSWAPVKGVRLSTVGAYTEATLTEDAAGLGGFAGNQLAFVPKFSNTVNLDGETSLGGDLDGFAGVSWQHVSARRTGFSSSPEFPGHIRLPGYDMLNAQAGLRFKDIELSVYARNLTNTLKLTSYNMTGGFNNTGTAQILQPRTIGLKLSMRY